ncbi:MAG TPA: 50S ribosomal protein L10 [Acidobacteriota bacterium]|nr:50S ribosomal protein L10 [Acidobacteriota bacterium]
MEKTEKQQLIAELNQAFGQNKTVLLMSFSGLNVADVTELRRKIRESGSGYRVVKNTLAIRAAENTPVVKLSSQFTGPTAVAYTSGDPVTLAKILTDFVKTHPSLTFKGGVLEDDVLTPQQCETLAEMPSKEVLLGKLLYLLNVPVARLAGALNSPLVKMTLLLKQLAERKAQ